MLLSNLPAKFPVPFANAAGASYIRPIPVPTQVGITPGAASLADGFPQICFIPTTSNGIPPAGQDLNGILNQITAWNRWQNAGGTVPYDATFSAAIGGYPYGAIVQSTVSGKLWMSVVDGNTTNPDSGGSGWVTAFNPIQAHGRVNTNTGGGAVAISGSTNVSSITRGTVTYSGQTMNTISVNFITAMSNANYSILITGGIDSVGPSGAYAFVYGTPSTTSFTILMLGQSSGVYPDQQTNLSFAVLQNL
jgi:hypothetical protein